jgi:hypothetical protein
MDNKSEQIISSSEPKARKDHVCDWCEQKISKGHKYMRSFNKCDGIVIVEECKE